MEQQSKSKSTSQKKEIHFHSSFILLSDTPEFWPNKSTDHEKAPCIIRANKNAFTQSMRTIDVAGRALGVSALAVALSNALGSNSYFMCCKYLFLPSRRERTDLPLCGFMRFAGDKGTSDKDNQRPEVLISLSIFVFVQLLRSTQCRLDARCLVTLLA